MPNGTSPIKSFTMTYKPLTKDIINYMPEGTKLSLIHIFLDSTYKYVPSCYGM